MRTGYIPSTSFSFKEILVHGLDFYTRSIEHLLVQLSNCKYHTGSLSSAFPPSSNCAAFKVLEIWAGRGFGSY